MSERLKKVNSLVFKELSKILAKMVLLSDHGMITITAVDVAPDLKTATVWISILPEDKEKDALLFLKSNDYEIRNQLKDKITFKYIPILNYKLDRSLKNAAIVEKLLEEI